ncbi:MAG: hypothetical protein ACOC1F_08725 [Myxococcota bacterium]
MEPSQESLVQGFWSFVSAGVPLHLPRPSQRSARVQALLSLHRVPKGLASCWQDHIRKRPEAVQLSSVHGLSSLQIPPGVRQVPEPLQMLVVRQNDGSEQEVP